MLRRLSVLFVTIGLVGLPGSLAPAQEVTDFSFLDQLDEQPVAWNPEETPPDREDSAAVNINLGEYYREFREDKKVTMYMGYGYESYFEGRFTQLYNMLLSLSSYYGLPLNNWFFNGSRIRFRDYQRGIDYVIDLGASRNEYIDAFSNYEIVLYHGHSRYGQGPAFGTFWNYFRIGSNFETIEVDTRNPYFQKEPILKTDRYDLKSINIGGQKYPYQYRGQKDHRSYLPDDSFTKIIPGLTADLEKTKFLPKRQIFYFYSCKNRKYWRDSLRKFFPDVNQKFVFGTKEDAWGGTKPEAVMIISLVRGLLNSERIVDELNATNDCANCFTTY